MQMAARSRNEWLIASQTQPGVLYLVKRVKGVMTCSCPGNFHHGHCKHCKAVAATLPKPTTKGPSAADTAKLFMAPRHR